MKKTILLFALIFTAGFIFSQDVRLEKKEKKDLTPIQFKINKEGWFMPNLKFNYYFNDKTILHVEGPSLSRAWIRNAVNNDYYDFGLFLEKRKFIGNSKTYLTHGPAIGYVYDGTSDFSKNEFRAGYNLGVGIQVNRHITAGTYMNPYISYDGNNIDILHGRIAVGALRNMYLAYRF